MKESQPVRYAEEMKLEWGQQTQKGQTSLELTTATTTGHEASRNKFPIMSAWKIYFMIKYFKWVGDKLILRGKKNDKKTL